MCDILLVCFYYGVCGDMRVQLHAFVIQVYNWFNIWANFGVFAAKMLSLAKIPSGNFQNSETSFPSIAEGECTFRNKFCHFLRIRYLVKLTVSQFRIIADSYEKTCSILIHIRIFDENIAESSQNELTLYILCCLLVPESGELVYLLLCQIWLIKL